ncbi:MAG: sigma-70 family RNA polymerase sigma factor [Synechococcus sp.]|nr:sigma-70 family RNA polymerase sigma factor [Synechococcus sp.]
MAEPVRAYLEQIGRYALLRADEELQLARLVQRLPALQQLPLPLSPPQRRELRRAQRARERMIQANLRLVVMVAKGYQGRGLELMDLVQEGSLGLIRAVEKFDPTLGYRFSTYAWNWIRQAITRGLETKARTLRLPIHVNQQLRALGRARETLSRQGQATSLEALALEAKLPLAAAALALRMAPDAVSLDAPVGGGESDLIELLPALQPSPMERLERCDHLNRIDTQLQHLPPRDRTVLRLRYFTAQRAKLSVVGDALGCSRERARQIEKRALLRLRLRLVS